MTYIGKIFETLSGSFLAISEPNEKGETECLSLAQKSTLITHEEGIFEIPERVVGQDLVVFLHKKNLLKKNSLIKQVAQIDQKVIAEILKKLVLIEARRYFDHVHEPEQKKPFLPLQSKVNYAGRVYNFSEIENLIDSSLEFYLTAGRYDAQFCSKLSSILSGPHRSKIKVSTTNSGSSANLLAISALTSYELGSEALREGDEVITVAAGFPTTIAPIIQNKLVPVFIDVELGSYNISAENIEKSLTKKTKALFIAHTLGIPFNIDAILEIAEKNNLWLIEDNCDALGASYSPSKKYKLKRQKLVDGDGFTGTFGHIATSSFYPAHQITMGEGGAVYTDSHELHKILQSFRDWGRDCWCNPGKDNTCGKRFGWQLGNLPEGYDHKYIYSHLGYNLKLTDMQAAVGVAQLDKLSGFVENRLRNWHRLLNGLKDLEEYFVLPHFSKSAQPSPFGFALTIRMNAGFTREEITSFLEKNKIQTRTVFSGNILRQPAITNASIPMRIQNSTTINSAELTGKYFSMLPNTETVMRNTFWVGVYPALRDEMIDFVVEKIRDFTTRRSVKP